MDEVWRRQRDPCGEETMTNPMFEFDERLAAMVFDYCRNRLALDPVPLDFGGAQETFDEVLTGMIGDERHDPKEVLEVFADHLATAVISCDSPRFLSFVPAAPTKAALLFDMVVSCSSLQGTSWLEAAGAVAAENQALRFLADLAGFPSGSGGCFVPGGSIGNLSALAVARHTALKARRDAVHRPRMAVSEEVHSSVGNALRIMNVEPLAVPSLDHRMTGASLRAVLESSPDAADVVGVVATAGTTNAGLVDDLEGIADVCRDRGLWLHVDAAYGGAGLFSPLVRHLFAGIERADSFIIDPHKWLFAPFDCAALLYREPELAKAVHAQEAAYLDPIHDESATGWNPSDYAIHLTRRARGLPLWFSLAVHGGHAYRAAVEGALSTARQSADLIARTPYLELVRAPELSIVLFRRREWGRQDYRTWSRRLLEDQIGFVTPTSWEGETCARLAFLHPATTLAMVEEILATMA
jgi:glutamate/tyrosine decarboxylase-like PLP-dependent enzyme